MIARDRWEQLTGPVRERKLPYVFVFGNHDAEADLTRQQIVDIDGCDAACLMPSSKTSVSACYFPCDPGQGVK